MAALDWIKLSCDLPQKWQVLTLRRALKCRSVDEVIGKLYRLWCHFENQSKSGHIKGLIPDDIDAICGKKGFADAVVDVGWLAFDDGGAKIPAYDEYMGAASKKRDAESERQRQHRDRHANDTHDRRDAGVTDRQTGRDKTVTDRRDERDESVTQETETDLESETDLDSKDPPTPTGDEGQPSIDSDSPDRIAAKAEAQASRTRLSKLFADFWSVYPKKHSKQDADKAFHKLNPSPELFATILEAVSRQTLWEQWMKNDRQYVPLPATWLRGQKWNDEPPASMPVQYARPVSRGDRPDL